MKKKSSFILFLTVIVFLTVSLSSCGDEDKDEPSSNQYLYVNGEKWEISNYMPPRFVGDFDYEMFNYTPYIISAALRKKDKNEKHFFYNSGLVISITQSVWYPESLKIGENLVGNIHIEDIDVSYGIFEGSTEVEGGTYRCFWPGRERDLTEYNGSGSIIIKELVKQKKLTLQFRNFKIPSGQGSNCKPYLTLDGTVTFQYEGGGVCIYP